MKCIIIGAGKVGYYLAATLCKENHAVTVIDKNRRRLEMMEDYLNIKTMEGNAARMDILASAGIDDTDLFIAVTEKDELNMVACLFAKKAGAKNTVARVRNPDYGDLDQLELLSSLGIDLIINPEKVAAFEISRLLSFPEARHVSFFGGGSVQILDLRIEQNCPQLNRSLMEIKFPAPCIIVSVERDEQITIPRGDYRLTAGDHVLLLANTADMRKLESFLGIAKPEINNIIILGGDIAGFYLAGMLEKHHKKIKVRIFEKDYGRCADMASSLTQALIINGGADAQLFQDENIGSADAFIALTHDDKENLFACILAKSFGVPQTIAQVRTGELAQLMENAGIDKVVSPRRLTADAILRFIDRKRIISITSFEDGQAQIMEVILLSGSLAANKAICDLNFPREAIIGMIIRGGKHIVPSGQDILYADDRIIIFAKADVLKDVEDLFATKHDY